MAIIYLSACGGSICLPCILSCKAGLERAALKEYYMWHFSMQGLPTNDVAINSRGLLPHVFTLIPLVAGRLFSVALSLPGKPGAPLITGCIALCCPDFPPPADAESDSPACSGTKVKFNTGSIFPLPRNQTSGDTGLQTTSLLSSAGVYHVFHSSVPLLPLRE